MKTLILVFNQGLKEKLLRKDAYNQTFSDLCDYPEWKREHQILVNELEVQHHKGGQSILASIIKYYEIN